MDPVPRIWGSGWSQHTFQEDVSVSSAAIRPATPKDTPFLAWAILTATRSHLPRGWFDIALDLPEKACLEFLNCLTTTESLSQWHYSRFLIAESHGCPIATLCAFRARDAYPAWTAALMETLKAQQISPVEAESIWRRGAYMFKCTMRPDDDWWVIENLATLPEYRGRGYTAELLSHAIETGRVEGSTHAQVSLFIGNDRAERAYVRAGFQLVKERRDSHFEAVSGASGLRQYIRGLRS